MTAAQPAPSASPSRPRAPGWRRSEQLQRLPYGSLNPRSAYDTVVVGGGHNGLAASAYLARAGRSCLVLERRATLGGAAVSEEVFAGMEASLSRYSYLVSLLPARIVRELALPLRLARRRVASYTPDPRQGARAGLLLDTTDPSATLASFEAITGSSSALRAWEELHERIGRVARAVFPTLIEPLRSRAELRSLVGDDEAWAALFESPLHELLARTFSDELIAGVVLSDALIGTFAAAADAGLRQNRCFLYHVIGGGTGEWLLPVGGMGAVSSALAHAARAAGATLRTRAEVIRLEPHAGAVDVSFTDGVAEHAVRARHVLVNAAPAELDRLLGAAPAPRPEGSQLKINMLLARLPRLRDPAVAPERAFAGTFHVNETSEQLQRAYEQAARDEVPDPAPCECYCHSLSDPSILGEDLRSSGAHTLTVFGLHMPARLFEADHDARRQAALEATLASLASVLAEPIAACVLRTPEGAPCIEAHTPLDIERDLRMPGGHIFHNDLSWPFAEREDQVGTWGVQTAHPRILICGAGARRGGGVSCVPGRNAAMAALAEPRPCR